MGAAPRAAAVDLASPIAATHIEARPGGRALNATRHAVGAYNVVGRDHHAHIAVASPAHTIGLADRSDKRGRRSVGACSDTIAGRCARPTSHNEERNNC